MIMNRVIVEWNFVKKPECLHMSLHHTKLHFNFPWDSLWMSFQGPHYLMVQPLASISG
jgi:hypothetical protein